MLLIKADNVSFACLQSGYRVVAEKSGQWFFCSKNPILKSFQPRFLISFCFVRNSRNISYQLKKRNNFHLILNLDPFQIFRLNFGRNIPVSFYIFCFGLEKPLNEIQTSTHFNQNKS